MPHRRGSSDRASSRLRYAAVGLVACATWLAIGTSRAAEPAAPAKKPPRPERSAAERSAAARQLRDVYRRPPASWPAPHVDPGIEWREIGLLPQVVHPEKNPFNAAKAELGRLLFYDARLSADGKMACVSCHEPSLGWADGRAVSQPHGRTPDRNTPTIRNVAFQTHLFWDGRADSLERQVEDALTNPAEMAADRDAVVRLLARSPGYRKRFAEAFAGRPLEFAAVVEAVACFERTIVSGRSRFDRFMRGDAEALADEEILGLDLFRREARCMHCHHGPAFSDGRFHDLGLSFFGRDNEDLGRHAVTGAAGDKGRFRTPTLRDVTHTTPLMHTGMFELRGVLNMYNAGMVTLKRQPYQRDDPLFPVKSPHLKPLGLNRQDLADLEAFLAALAEPRQRVLPPALPEIEAEPVSGEPRRPAGH
jgi:cytochrome c peroxidase